MKPENFPALYVSAGHLSKNSQDQYFRSLRLHLTLLVTASFLSILTWSDWKLALVQSLVLFGALACSVYMLYRRPEKHWYGARAVAESVKTLTWRFVSRAEPFDVADGMAETIFLNRLKNVIDQNRELARGLDADPDGRQITDAMRAHRAEALENRKANYIENRIKDQLRWYANKAASNREAERVFSLLLILSNAVAVVLALLRIRYPEARGWPTDILIALAASLLGWIQAKRYSELAASYALTAHEIAIVREQAAAPGMQEDAYSRFVSDAENAFSREHTQWVARRDA